ncbi:MAG: hypothetical protein JJU36_03790 [Phycisphaeraceae bacterium]|nr:hypothetical protein [Phycisphaeraceae bacterium]
MNRRWKRILFLRVPAIALGLWLGTLAAGWMSHAGVGSGGADHWPESATAPHGHDPKGPMPDGNLPAGLLPDDAQRTSTLGEAVFVAIGLMLVLAITVGWYLRWSGHEDPGSEATAQDKQEDRHDH